MMPISQVRMSIANGEEETPGPIRLEIFRINLWTGAVGRSVGRPAGRRFDSRVFIESSRGLEIISRGDIIAGKTIGQTLFSTTYLLHETH